MTIRLVRAGAALAAAIALIVMAVGCQPAPPPLTSHSPAGNFESAERLFDLDAVQVAGWAFDVDTTDSVHVMVWVLNTSGGGRWVNGWETPESFVFPANGLRPDVDAAFGRGQYVGFVVNVSVDYEDAALICVVALNVDLGDHSVLGCRRP